MNDDRRQRRTTENACLQGPDTLMSVLITDGDTGDKDPPRLSLGSLGRRKLSKQQEVLGWSK